MGKINWYRYFAGLMFSFSLVITGFLVVDRDLLSLQAWEKIILTMELRYLLILLVLLVALWLVESLRTRRILKILKINLSLNEAAELTLATAYGTAVSPLGLGGPSVQVYLLYRRGIDLNKGIVVSTVQGLLMQLILVPLALGALLYVLYVQASQGIWFWAIPIASLLVLLPAMALGLVCARPAWVSSFARMVAGIAVLQPVLCNRRLVWRIYRELHRARHSLILLLNNRREFCWLVASSLLIWLIIFSMGPILLLGFGGHTSWGTLVAQQILVYFISTSLPLPGGSGIQEMGLASALGSIMPRHLIPSFVAGWRFLTYYVNILLGLPVLLIALRK